jgi:fibronectin-binding autotransporter adhesin
MADKTWVGGTSDDAAVAGNWSPSGVPAYNDKVVIPDASTTSNDCRLTTATSWGTLTIATDGILVGNGQTLTLNGGVNDGGTAADFNYTDAGQTSNVSGNLDITMRNLRSSGDRAIITAAANNIRNLKIDDFTADGGGTGKVYHFQCNLTISGDLTVEYGELNTAFSSTSYNLTVAGKTTLGPDTGAADKATLSCNASTVSLGSGKTDGLGLHVRQGGTFVGGSGTHTMGSIGVDNNAAAKFTNTSGTNTLNGHSNDSVRVIIGGANSTCTAAGTIEITYAGGGYNLQNGNAAMINNLTFNSNVTANLSADTSITGNLTITQGLLTTTTNNYALTVTGDCYVAGTLTGNASAISLGSLEVAASGTYNATTGTTTITDEDSVTGYTWDVNGTFNNNDGGVTFDLGSGVDSHIRTGQSDGANSFHNLTVLLNASTNTLTMRPNAGTVMTIEGNLTISEGVLQKNTHSHTLTVTGNVEIHAGGKIDATSASGAMNMGSLSIDAGGTYLATSGTTTITGVYSSPFALTNSGTFTNNDGTLLLNRAGNQEFLGTWTGSSALHNLTIDGGNGTKKIRANMLIEGDLNVTANDTFTTHGNTETLTVNGDVEVSGTLGATSQTGAYSFNSLTTQNGGTFVASSGTTTILVDIRNRTGATFTHNGGTVLITTGATYFIHNTGTYSTITFNNLTYSGANSYLVKDIIVEGTFSNPSGYIRLTSGAKITLGTTTSQGTLAMGSNKLFPYATWYLYGASELFPGIVTGTNATPIKFSYGEGGANSANLKWLDIQFDINDVGGDDNYTITLDGSCEFDAVTIDADCTLDLNGQRAVFGGAFDLTTGALAMNDSMAVFTNTIDFNGRVPTSNTGTTIIHNPPSTSEKLITSLYFGGTFFAQGAESDVNGYAWGGSSGEYPAKVFVGGQLDCQQSVKTTTTMQVATGGELRGNDRTITCEGDFTTSGGLIGKSAVLFDGTNDVGSAPSATASTTNPTDNLFVEAWWKSTNTTPETTSVIGKEDSYLLYINSSGYFQGYVYGSSSDISVSGGWMGSIFDQKWHHIAMGYSQAGGLKIWLDGRLVGYNATNAGTLNQNANGLRIMRYGSNYGQGTVAMGRIWTGAVPTDAQLRSNMFKGEADSPAYTSGVIQTAWYFDEGTGTTVEDVGVGTDADLLLEGSPAWAGAGTFTEGTSTVDMTGNGKTMCFNGDTEFYNLNVAASGKTTNIYNNLNVSSALYIVSGGTLTHGGGTFQVSGGSSGYYPKVVCQGTYTAGADFESLYTFYFVGQSVSNVQPAGKFNYLIYDNAYNGGTNYTTSLAGNITGSNYISIQDSCGLNTRSSGVDYNIDSSRMILKNSASLTLNSSTLKLTNTTGLDLSTTTNTFSAGPGCVISGSSAGTTFKSQNNFAVVGEIVNLNVTNEELKVTGQVINCTGDIHQYFPTIDHAQQLDADTADDRDVRLGRDLDKNTELINS